MDSTLRLRAINFHNLPVVNIEEEEGHVPTTRKRASTRQQTLAVSRDLPQLCTGMDEKEESEKHIQQVMTSEAASEIPIPTVRPVADYEKSYSHSKYFQIPQEYIEYNDTMTEGLGHLIEYDLDDEDELFLEKLNAEEELLTEDKFEFIIDRFEKTTFYTCQGTIPSLEDLEPMLRTVPTEVLTAVYTYWKERRTDCGFPLIPRFSLLRNDLPVSSPFNAFRVHKDAFKKKHRRNDILAYQKMWRLRQEMEKARLVLETIIKREKEKKELIAVTKEITEVNIESVKKERETKKPKRTSVKSKSSKSKQSQTRNKKNSRRSLVNEKRNLEKVEFMETDFNLLAESTKGIVQPCDVDSISENAATHRKKPFPFTSKLYFTC